MSEKELNKLGYFMYYGVSIPKAEATRVANNLRNGTSRASSMVHYGTKFFVRLIKDNKYDNRYFVYVKYKNG